MEGQISKLVAGLDFALAIIRYLGFADQQGRRMREMNHACCENNDEDEDEDEEDDDDDDDDDEDAAGREEDTSKRDE